MNKKYYHLHVYYRFDLKLDIVLFMYFRIALRKCFYVTFMMLESLTLNYRFSEIKEISFKTVDTFSSEQGNIIIYMYKGFT